MRRWKRVDPDGCGCTDCLTGWSIPVNKLSPADVDAIERGLDFHDATGMTEEGWDKYIWPWEA